MVKKDWFEALNVKDAEVFSKVVELLKEPESSPLVEELYVRAKKGRSQLAKVWGAIGLDYAACEMNCAFCSLSATLAKNVPSVVLSDEEILSIARHYVAHGVYWLVLRTTEFYPFASLVEKIRLIREKVPGAYVLTVNTGNAQTNRAQELKAEGVEMVYQAIRLREGVDTNFSVAERKQAMSAVKESGLLLSQYIEPIGSEHTDEEIAARILEAVKVTDVLGVMPRVNVVGSKKAAYPEVSEERLTRIVAILRLLGGKDVDIIIHPYSKAALEAGANALVVDIGAIPREKGLVTDAWDGQDVLVAKERLMAAGYEMRWG